MSDLTAERLRAVLDYDPEAGTFTWANRPRNDFANSQAYGSFVTRCLGKEAGSPTMNGYRRITVDTIKYLSHRLAWLHFYGVWPSQHIDHINGDGCDNRIANLRDVSNADNHRNLRLMKTNISGVAGVRHTPYGTFSATIWQNSKIIHLGSFKTKEEAIAARKAAERQLGYHPNHGRAA
jgi:hypothetical protein